MRDLSGRVRTEPEISVCAHAQRGAHTGALARADYLVTRRADRVATAETLGARVQYGAQESAQVAHPHAGRGLAVRRRDADAGSQRATGQHEHRDELDGCRRAAADL